MFTGERSLVAKAIIDYRSIRGLSQEALAREVGISGGYLSCLEKLSEDRVTPAIYKAFQDIGFDLKTPVPALLIQKIAGKDRKFKTNISEKVSRKDPIKLLAEAKSLVSEANTIINTKINAWDVDVEKKEGEIRELRTLKSELQSQRAQLLDEIISA